MKTRQTHWLDTARAVVAQQQFQFVDADSGAVAGRKRTNAAWREIETPETEAPPPRFEPANMPKKKRKRATVALDMVTASMLVQVHDALGEKNRAHFAALPLRTAVAVGWKLVR